MKCLLILFVYVIHHILVKLNILVNLKGAEPYNRLPISVTVIKITEISNLNIIFFLCKLCSLNTGVGVNYCRIICFCFINLLFVSRSSYAVVSTSFNEM